MKDSAKAGFQAAIVAIAPTVMLVGYLYHPFIANLATDTEAVAAAARQDTFRWAVAHLLVAIGSGLIALAFLAIRAWLRETGEDRWSLVSIPFVVMASGLYSILPGMEFAIFAAVETGGDPAAAQAVIDPWFLPLLLTAAATFAIGVIGFAMSIARSGVLTPQLTAIVAGALVIMGIARFVPLGLVQFYVNGFAGIVALWPLAYAMWRGPQIQRAGHPRSMSAS
jgi:hypothetical protein